MKILLVFLTFLLAMTSRIPLHAENLEPGSSLFLEIEREALAPFFKALTDGDLDTIKHYVSEDMYRKYRVLIEQNPQYSQFLRDFYRGTAFKVEKAEQVREGFLVDLTIADSEGNRGKNKLLLQKNTTISGDDLGKKTWKISKFHEEKLPENLD